MRLPLLLLLLCASANALTLRRTQTTMLFNFGGAGSGGSIPSSKKIAVVTGTTSGLGLETARALLNRGDYHVVCANRNVEKMREIAEAEGFNRKDITILPLDLDSFESTRAFAKKLLSSKTRPLDALVCNAAVYQPALDKVRATLPRGFMSLAVMHPALHSLSLPLSLSLFFFFRPSGRRTISSSSCRSTTFHTFFCAACSSTTWPRPRRAA